MSIGVGIELDLVQVSRSDVNATPENNLSFPLPHHYLPAPPYTCLIGSSHQHATIPCFPDDGWAARDVDLEFELSELPESRNHRTWLSRKTWIRCFLFISPSFAKNLARSLIVCGLRLVLLFTSVQTGGASTPGSTIAIVHLT